MHTEMTDNGYKKKEQFKYCLGWHIKANLLAYFHWAHLIVDKACYIIKNIKINTFVMIHSCIDIKRNIYKYLHEKNCTQQNLNGICVFMWNITW
jgi:accessory gene regulator protein AgrB